MKTPPHFGTARIQMGLQPLDVLRVVGWFRRKEPTRAPSLRLEIDRNHRGDSGNFRLDAGVSSQILDLVLTLGQRSHYDAGGEPHHLYSLKNVAVTIGVEEPMTLMLVTSDPKKRQ